jgi:hypothetical protein
MVSLSENHAHGDAEFDGSMAWEKCMNTLVELAVPSAEDEAIDREAARRAWILREHAELTGARGDTSRLKFSRAFPLA